MCSFQMAALHWFGEEKEGKEVGGAGLLIVEETEAGGKLTCDYTAGRLRVEAPLLFLSLGIH